MADQPDEQLQARVAALRKLAAQDVVPAVQDIVQLCVAGAEVEFKRAVAGPGRLVGYTKPVRLRFEAASENSLRVSEAAVVLGATISSAPATTWRGAHTVELGCGAGFIGVLLATLGAQVTLTDLPHMAGTATESIALNSPAIRTNGSATFCTLDWTQSRAAPAAQAALARASVVIASDPADDAESQQNFLEVVKAMYGLNGEPPLCRSLQLFLVAHKHQQNYCICGYSAPAADARPTITHAEERDRCLLRRSLEDIGLSVGLWQKPPKEFAHPFVECWTITPSVRA